MYINNSVSPRANKFFGPVNHLINNASVFENDNINNFTIDSWSKHININLYAPLKLSQDVRKLLPAKSKGHIINILDQNVIKPERPGIIDRVYKVIKPINAYHKGIITRVGIINRLGDHLQGNTKLINKQGS